MTSCSVFNHTAHSTYFLHNLTWQASTKQINNIWHLFYCSRCALSFCPHPCESVCVGLRGFPFRKVLNLTSIHFTTHIFTKQTQHEKRIWATAGERGVPFCLALLLFNGNWHGEKYYCFQHGRSRQPTRLLLHFARDVNPLINLSDKALYSERKDVWCDRTCVYR